MAVMDTYMCNNAQCRIQTFMGASMMPLNTCPICIMPGMLTNLAPARVNQPAQPVTEPEPAPEVRRAVIKDGSTKR